MELRRAAGGPGVPQHLAVWLATLIDATELNYLDVVIREHDGHIDIELVAVAGRTMFTGQAQGQADSDRPPAADTQLTARSVSGIRTIEMRGAGDARPHAVSITFLDGATVLVPLSEIARPSVPGLLRKLVHGGLGPR